MSEVGVFLDRHRLFSKVKRTSVNVNRKMESDISKKFENEILMAAADQSQWGKLPRYSQSVLF